MSHSQEFPTSYPPPRPLRDIYQGCHKIWWARVIITLVAFLHTKHRLSFRGCSLLLFCLNTIFMTLALLLSTQNLPLTLNTVIHRLDLGDRFMIHPVCKNCHRIFSTDIPIDSSCPDCKTKLFKPVSDGIFQRITDRRPKCPPPVCAAPIHLPSSLLVDFLARAEIEKACDSWKQQARVPGKINDISEGRIWSSLKDKEGNLFFSKDSASEELHLRITLSLDWYRAENLLVGFMTPRPTEPSGAQLQNYMKLIVDDLLNLYDNGVVYYTPAYPQGIPSYIIPHRLTKALF
ncbi:hypothetical protein DFH29DRAFT_817045 [Suillus ampliporus]|nr:hypothetical protein DFH29DRAFT_817045 [Suillus ampliporus]